MQGSVDLGLNAGSILGNNSACITVVPSMVSAVPLTSGPQVPHRGACPKACPSDGSHCHRQVLSRHSQSLQTYLQSSHLPWPSWPPLPVPPVITTVPQLFQHRHEWPWKPGWALATRLSTTWGSWVAFHEILFFSNCDKESEIRSF